MAGGGAAKSLALVAAPQQALTGTVDQALDIARIGAQLASDAAALALSGSTPVAETPGTQDSTTSSSQSTTEPGSTTEPATTTTPATTTESPSSEGSALGAPAQGDES